MRYHYNRPDGYRKMHGITYMCDHPAYNRCTLYLDGIKGLAVIQQRYDIRHKYTYWTEIDPWLIDDIYEQEGFEAFFNKRAGGKIKGCYPTVTVRQIMWALRMKPLKKERWETVFDRKDI